MGRGNTIRKYQALLGIAGLLTTAALTTGCKKEEIEPDLSKTLNEIDQNETTIDDYIYNEEINIMYYVNGEEISTKRTLDKAAIELEENIKIYQLLKDFNVDSSFIKEENEGMEYEVTSGDTLSEIALKYNTFVDKIKLDNDLKSDVLSVGQILKIKPNVNVPTMSAITLNLINLLTEFNNKETNPERRIEIANELHKIKLANKYYFEHNSMKILIDLEKAVVKCSTLDVFDLSINSYDKVTIGAEYDNNAHNITLKNYDIDEKGKPITTTVGSGGLISDVISSLYGNQQKNRTKTNVTDEFVSEVTEDLLRAYSVISVEKEYKKYPIFGDSITAKESTKETDKQDVKKKNK